MRNPPDLGGFFAYQGGFRGIMEPGGEKMKEDEKKLPNWELADPKLPVIQSGHFENRRQHEKNTVE